MWTSQFWRAAAERAISTIAQSGLAVFVVGQTNILDLDYRQVLGVAAAAGVASILKSLAVGSVTGEPGFGTAETLR